MPKAAAKTTQQTRWQVWSSSGQALEELCGWITEGDSLTGIARDLGIGRVTLLDWIAADADRSARVKAARIAAAAAWDEQAQAGIEAAGDPFELAKAKEMAHHLRWRASKIAPREYGDKMQHGGADDLPPMQHQHSGALTVDPGDAYMRMIGK